MSDESYSALKNADRVSLSKTYHQQTAQNREVVVKPWRGIDTETMPQAIKKLLKPHWSAWILANPEYAKNNPEAKTTIIVKNSKSFDKVSSLRQVIPGQAYFVFREKPASPKLSGGGPPLKPEYIKESYVPEPPVKHPDRITILEPINHDFLRVGRDKALSYDNPEGPFTIHIKGLVSQSSTYQVDWREFFKDETRKKNLVQQTTKGEDIPWQDQISGLDYGEYTIGAVTENGISHSVKITIKPEEIKIGEIFYEPETRTFYLFDQAQYQALLKEIEPFDHVISNLEQAYQSKDDEQISKAKGEFDATMQPLVDAGGETSTLTEVIGFRGKKYTYVTSDKMKNHTRSYQVTSEVEKKRIIKDGKFDYKKFKEECLSTQATIEYTFFKVDPHAGSLNSWAEGINRKLDDLLGNQEDLPPDRLYDTSKGAQILRYSYGSSTKSNFSLKDKTFGIKSETNASFAIAEGKIGTDLYGPSAEGFHMTFEHTVEHGPHTGKVYNFDFGHVRSHVSMSVAGFSGASFQASGGLYFEVEDGKVQARGATKNSSSSDESIAGVGGEAFVGLKATGQLTGAFEWQNPENENNWASIMGVGCGGNVSFGAGAEFNFYITYFNGKFVARAKAFACWGGGAGGAFTYTIGADTIVDFCTFIYHQLKNEDFHFVDILSEEAFNTYRTIVTYIAMTKEALVQVYEEGAIAVQRMEFYIKDQLDLLLQDIKNQQQASAFAKEILYGDLDVSFLPPESKGQILYSLCPTSWKSFELKQELAILKIMRTIQTWHEYVEIMSHCTETGAKVHDNRWQTGEREIYKVIDGFGAIEYDFRKIRLWLNRNKNNLPQQAQINTAVVRNNGLADIA